METKNLLGITVLPMAILGGTIACLVYRVRDLFFLLFIVLVVMTWHLDVNFVSREWYRGTTLGFEFSTVDILSISIFLSSLLRPRPECSRWYWPASLGFMLLYFLYACFSVGISDPKLFGFFELSKILRGMIVFLAAALFVRSERELRMMVVALACAVCWQGLLAFYQRYHDGMFRVTGKLGDPNSLSMYLCLTAPVFVAAVTADFPRRVRFLCAAAIVLAGLGVILTISRAGVATMVVVMFAATAACVSWRMSLKKIFILSLALLVACAAFIKARTTLESRYKEASLKEEYEGKGQGRGYYIRIAAAIIEDRWLGVGLNNWSYWVSNEYGPKLGWRFVPYIGTEHWPSDVVPPGRNLDAAQAAPAHNLGALTVGELGLPGLFIFSLLWLRWFQMGAGFLWQRSSDPMLRMGTGFFFCTWGIFLQSLTEWAYRQTHIFFTFHLIMGALASLYFIKREHKRREVEFADADEDAGWPEYEDASFEQG